MSTVLQQRRPVAAPGTCCLLLQLEPTPYILPRALYVYEDPELHTDLVWTFVNGSQDWGKDAEIGELPVLLDQKVPRWRRLGRVAKLMWSILRGRYTVAHLAGWGHWVIRLAILCCKLRGVPFSVESDTQLNSDLTGWREWLKRQIYPIMLSWPAVVIPGGTRQANLFRYYGVREEKIEISQMSVDTNHIRAIQTPPREQFRIEHGIPDQRVVALFVGRLVKQKGIDVLLKAFEDAIARNDRLDLVVIGDGPQHSVLKEAERNFAGRLRYIGRQAQRDVVAWMRACDFLVLPSNREPWGLVVNEALTCGLPVVVSCACGCADDLVQNESTGITVPTGDSQALADAMTELAIQDARRAAMSKEAQRVIEPWVIERQAETIRSALVKMSYLK